MLPSSDDYEIAPETLAALLGQDDGPALRLVDCREEDEFAICRLAEAELIPLSRFAAEAPAKLLHEKRGPVVVYRHHGMRSMRATLFLRQRGKADVWSLAGGIDLWSLSIDPAVPRY